MILHYHFHSNNSYCFYNDEPSTKLFLLFISFILFPPYFIGKKYEASVTYQVSSVSENKVAIWILVFQTRRKSVPMIIIFPILSYGTLDHDNIL